MRCFIKIKDTELFLRIEKEKEPQFTLLRFASNFDKEKDQKFMQDVINDFANQNIAKLEIIDNI